MREWLLPYGIGALSGSRSMLGPAIAANAAGHTAHPLTGTLAAAASGAPGAARATIALAAGEMLADKSARIGSRTDTLPLIGRVASGSLSAAALAPGGRRLQWAAAGALGALTATYALFHLRKFAGARLHAPDAVLGLVEDAAAVAAGVMLMRRR